MKNKLKDIKMLKMHSTLKQIHEALHDKNKSLINRLSVIETAWYEGIGELLSNTDQVTLDNLYAAQKLEVNGIDLLTAFMENSPSIFTLMDSDLNIVAVSNSTLAAMKLSRSEIVGKHITDISPDAVETGRYNMYLDVVKTGKSFNIQELKVHPSLGNMKFSIQAFKVGTGIAVIATDITNTIK